MPKTARGGYSASRHGILRARYIHVSAALRHPARPSAWRPPLHHTAKAPCVEPRRLEPQEPRAHRPHHDRRRRLRRTRADEPQAGADPVDRVPRPRRRVDLPRRVARGREQRRVDPDRERHPGRARARVVHRDQHDERLDRAGLVHLRHGPRDRRAEDDAGDQPHLRPAARRGRAECDLGQHRRLPGHPGRGHRLRRRRDDPGPARGERRPRARGRRRASTPLRSSAASASASRSPPTRRRSPRPGYTQQAIRDALDQNGVLFPGGDITEDDETLTVQTGSKVTSVDEIAALPLVPSTPEQFEAGARDDRGCRDGRAEPGPDHDDLARRRRAGDHDRGHEAPRRRTPSMCRRACSRPSPTSRTT